MSNRAILIQFHSHFQFRKGSFSYQNDTEMTENKSDQSENWLLFLKQKYPCINVLVFFRELDFHIRSAFKTYKLEF